MGVLRARGVFFPLVVAIGACGDGSSGANANDAGLTLPSPPCEPGTWPAANGGACVPAGIPDGGCGEGFASDGHRACVAIMPPAACARGTMAVPGDVTCREPMPCADGTWGDIPTDASTQFVDIAYANALSGVASDGTQAHPWVKIADAIGAASPGATIAIAAGTYPELVVVQKKVTLAGRCPRLVDIQTPAGKPASLVLREGSDGAVVRGVGISSGTVADGVGVLASGTQDTVLDGVWIHDTTSIGLAISNKWGNARVTLRGSLVEHARGLVAVSGLSGILTIEGTDVRDIDAGGPSQEGGRAIDYETDDPSVPDWEKLVVRGSVIEEVRGVAMFLVARDATIERTLVRNIGVDPFTKIGRGITVQSDTLGNVRAHAVVRQTIMDGVVEAGMTVEGGDAEVERVVVRNSRPNDDGVHGRGIQAQPDVTFARPILSVKESVFEDVREAGVVTVGGTTTIQSSIVRRVMSSQKDKSLGMGAACELLRTTEASPTPQRGDCTMRGSVVEHVHLMGMSAVGSDLVVDGTRLDDVMGQESDGRFGDGIMTLGGPVPAHVRITGSSISRSARAALANFASNANIAGTKIWCNALDLDGERVDDVAFAFADDGENACGCDAIGARRCTVLSASLEPPAPLR